MLNVLRLADASVWREIETFENGEEVGAKTQTNVAAHFKAELRRREAGEAPLRYYALFRPDGSVPVCLRIGDGPPTSPTGTLVTGRGNDNPFPKYGSEIATLGQHLRVPMGPSHYPYRRGSTR